MGRHKTLLQRWSSEHGGFVGRSGYRVPKINHRFRFTAWLHAKQLNDRFPEMGIHAAYPCRWGEQHTHGETARKHYHVGRVPTKYSPRTEDPMTRRWDLQIHLHSWPLQLGFHVDHTDPSITLHLPWLIVAVGRLKQPGFRRK